LARPGTHLEISRIYSPITFNTINSLQQTGRVTHLPTYGAECEETLALPELAAAFDPLVDFDPTRSQFHSLRRG
jgi:hypothetical protein